MGLHDSLHHRQPSLCYGEHEKRDTGPDHCACGARYPTDKPEIVIGNKVEINDHIATIHEHSLVHAHIHAIIMGNSPRNYDCEEKILACNKTWDVNDSDVWWR
jgi:hypothetical protein